MSRWCSKCHLTEYRSCDERCPVFGKHFEDLADKVIKLIEEKEKANMQGRLDERKEWECATGEMIIKYAEDVYTALPDVIKRVKADERERIVKELEKQEEHCLSMSDWQGQSAIEKAIEIARGGEND